MMINKPVIKGKMDVRFPANITAQSPITVNKVGNTYNFILDTNNLLNNATISGTATGSFYAPSARIQRLTDRVFMGGATQNTGQNVVSQPDWLTTFQLGTGRVAGFIQLSQGAILNGSDPSGSNALTVGTQTKNITLTGLNAIGSINVGVNNNNSIANVSAFASYNEAYRMSGALGGAYGYELDTVNYASIVNIDPFSQNIGQTIGLQLAAGAELSSVGQFPSSAAINIRNNNSSYRMGIIFGNDAIDGTNGTDGGTGQAIAMATGHLIEYFYSAGAVSWQLGAAIGAAGDYNFTTFGTGAVSVPRLKTNTVKFPAAQVASSDPNTLDDYEEGTFTPVITFGGASTGITYSTQTGKYSKIGNVVNVAIEVVLTSKGSSAGSMLISGLPFTVSSSISVAAAVRCANLAGTAITDLQGLFNSGLASANITRYAAGMGTALADTDLTNTSVIRIAGFYFVD